MIARDFFSRRAEIVAKELLGKILVRKLNGKKMKARIVEVEAYYGENDPASRACKNGDLRETMRMRGGTILVYGLHNHWLINFVTGRKNEAEAVLLRALEPLNFNLNCSGPGLLCKALNIDKNFHKKKIPNEELWLDDNENEEEFEIVASKRIGVKKDLPVNLRFYISGSKFVSRK